MLNNIPKVLKLPFVKKRENIIDLGASKNWSHSIVFLMQLFCLSVIVALSELPVNVKFRVHAYFVTFKPLILTFLLVPDDLLTHKDIYNRHFACHSHEGETWRLKFLVVVFLWVYW